MKDSPYNQIVIHTGLELKESERPEFIEFCEKELGVRVEYLDEFHTLPGQGGEGGRTDVMVKIHDADVVAYATARFGHGDFIGRWWDDYVDQHREIIPPIILKTHPV